MTDYEMGSGMRRRAGIVGIVVVAAIAAVAPGAQGATTLGSDLQSAASDGIFCPGICTSVQMELPTRTVAAPANGVLVRWRIRTNGPGGPFVLRVIRPVSGTTVTGIATSTSQSPLAAGIAEFGTRLPVRQGDRIGLGFTSTNSALFKSSVAAPGAMAFYFSPDVLDGATLPATIENDGTELLFNADFEPDADGDGFGDETQDTCPTIAGSAAGCASASPAIRQSAASRQRIKNLSANATLDRVATVDARAVVKYNVGKKRFKFKSKLVKALVGPGVDTKFAFAFTKSQRAKMNARLKLKKKLTAVITYNAQDTAGLKSTVTSNVRLKL